MEDIPVAQREFKPDSHTRSTHRCTSSRGCGCPLPRERSRSKPFPFQSRCDPHYSLGILTLAAQKIHCADFGMTRLHSLGIMLKVRLCIPDDHTGLIHLPPQQLSRRGECNQALTSPRVYILWHHVSIDVFCSLTRSGSR